MRIVFLQDLWLEWQAPMLLAALARRKGHQCEVIIDGNPRRAAARAVARRPDLVAFSVITGSHWHALACAEAVKRRAAVPVLLGGPHATLCPEDTAAHPAVDFVCRGEGEAAFEALCDRLSRGGGLDAVPGLWYRDAGGALRHNAPAPLADLDRLPFLDRDLYYRPYRVLRNEGTRAFYASRGCRHDCAYCCVPALRRSAGPGPRVRLRSPALVCREINEVRRRYGLRTVFFQDDTFAPDRAWTEELLGRYRAEVGLPFMCMLRATDLDEGLAASLANSGCVAAIFGVETGGEERRRRVLGRDEGDEDLLRAGRLLRRHRIRASTLNMIGLPGEDLHTARRTVELNRRIGVEYPWAVPWRPFPGTRLEEEAVAAGALAPGASRRSTQRNYYGGMLPELPEKAKLENLQRLFTFAVRRPWLMSDLVLRQRWLGPLYYLMFAAGSYWREVRLWRRSPALTLWTGVLNQMQYAAAQGRPARGASPQDDGRESAWPGTRV